VTPPAFIRAAGPPLAVELGLFLIVRSLFPSNELSFLALALVSWVVLPAWAGFRVARAGGGPRLATLGGISISAVTLTCATLAELLFTRDFPTLGGLALATMLIAVPIQALSGLMACWVTTRRARHGT